MLRVMKKIKLSTGEYALIDDEDRLLVSSFSWTNAHGYAQATLNRTTIRMHRLVLGMTNPKQPIDHINGNKLDNRKANLRLCTPSQNRMNTQKSSANKSGYKGVCWKKNTNDKHWCATIYKNYKQYHLGYFSTRAGAARAYDRAALKLHGEFARLNFPKGVTS